jgi:hypothetical protein
VLWVLIGWQFTLAEYVGGIVMILLMTLVLRGFVSPRLEREAGDHDAAIADLAGIAAIAIERTDEFAGRRIRIGSNELTARDAAGALSRVTGRRFSAQPLATDELAAGLRSLFTWLGQTEPGRGHPSATRTVPEGRMAHVRGVGAFRAASSR